MSGFVVVTPMLMHRSITFSNQRLSKCSPTTDVGFVKLCGNRAFKMNIQFCCHLCCSTCAIFRNSPQCTTISFCQCWLSPTVSPNFDTNLLLYFILYYIWVTVGVTQSVQRRAKSLTDSVWFPAGAETFLNTAQTGSGAHPASYPMGSGDYFPGRKTAGTWRWPLTSI
jgi:hypothetical protein